MKKIISLMLVLALLTGGVCASAEEQVEDTFDENEWAAVETMKTVDDLPLNVPSAVLMEKETGKVIYELNSHERLPPASVTKIMTLLLVVEAIEAGRLSLDEMVTASTHAVGMGGSQIYLKEGEQMSVADLLKSVTVASANDAAVALAEHIAGSEEAFVAMMNKRAQELGMKDTVFANCTGLPTDGEHLTTAYDIALMSRELIKHDLIKNYTKIWMDSVRDGQFGLSNTNKLIRYYNGATGLKTGFTHDAMYCLSATAERDGVEYIAVIMHAETSDIRFESAKILLNYAFANYTLVSALPDEALPPVEVTMGAKKYVQPVAEDSGKILLTKSDAAGVTKSVELTQGLEAPVKAGQQLGTLTISAQDGSEIATVPIVADEAVKRLNWGQIFTKYLRILCMADL